MSFFTTYPPHEILERLTIKLNELSQPFEISQKTWKITFEAREKIYSDLTEQAF